MKALLILSMLLLLGSCGKSQDNATDTLNCTTDSNAILKEWVIDGVTYDMTGCEENTVCQFCISTFCNVPEDVNMRYYGNVIELDYFNASRVIVGNWQVCNDTLELYNFNDGSEFTFTEK